TAGAEDLLDIIEAFSGRRESIDLEAEGENAGADFPTPHRRTTDYLTHPVFHQFQTETEILRYMTRLQSRDLSLAVSMIPLGSCTMKLNATMEMIPVTWPEFGGIHPFAPL